MHTDPLVDADRHLDRQAAHDRLYWQAFAMLQQDFMRAAAAGPRTLVATPYDHVEQQPLVAMVDAQIAADETYEILAAMLQVIVSAAHSGDRVAQALVESFAHAHASHYVDAMNEAGDLHE